MGIRQLPDTNEGVPSAAIAAEGDPMRPRRGMTLMELVVAIALTGMMAAAGAATFSSIIDHRRVIRESTVSTERAVALREMIRAWVAAGTIQLQIGGGPRGLASSARISARPGMAAGVTAAASTGDEITINTTAR